MKRAAATTKERGVAETAGGGCGAGSVPGAGACPPGCPLSLYGGARRVLAVAVLVVVAFAAAFAAVLAPAAAAPDAVAEVEAAGSKAAEGESPAVMVCPPLPEGIRRALAAAGTGEGAAPATGKTAEGVPPEDAGFSGGDGAAEGAEGAADRDNAVSPAVAGGIVPHHDPAGAMMLRFYDALAEAVPAPERIILIAPDHYRAGRSPVSTCGADWLTEFGLLSADREGIAALTGAGLVERQDRLFRSEHGITNHLPLLRRTFPGATVLPLVVRKGLSDLHLLALRKALLPLVERGGLILLSMDLSHGKTPAGAAAEDARTLPVLRELRTPALRGLDLDCPRGAALLFALLRDLGATQARLLDHTDSCLLLNDGRSPCTSYATLLYLRHSCGQRGAPSAR
ncbi:AmmeMemoRadiSam system protein B [Aminiphilus sp.]|uniref:AmmeMemoRadiSam system protein B n=1 Tax=Aminiphilus sp. TaxID=1872488 RepID=UPI002635AE98|nr:AmmeMemoRadiSam system protein B [Aminiphilus sp.]